MSSYDYYCKACEEVFEKDFDLGKASKKVVCSCGKLASRHYGNVSFVLTGSGWPSQTFRRKAEGLANNEAAGRRMRKEHSAPKLVDQR